MCELENVPMRKLLLKYLGEAHPPIELQVPPSCSFQELQQIILDKTRFEKERQILKSGFPPKPFALKENDLVFSVLGNLATVFLVKPQEAKTAKPNLKAARSLTARISAIPSSPAKSSVTPAASHDISLPSPIPVSPSSIGTSAIPNPVCTSASSSRPLPASHIPPSSSTLPGSSYSSTPAVLNSSGTGDAAHTTAPLLPDSVVPPSAHDLLLASAHRRKKSDLSSALTEGLGPEASMGVLFAHAASTPASELDPTLRMFRRCLKEEVIKRAEQTLAEQRVAASLSGEYEFLQPKGHSLSSFTVLRVKFKSGNKRFVEEEHSYIPKPFLKLTVANVMQGEAQWKENFRPYNMALVSPRVFWSLVKEFGGDVCSGLAQLCPEIDWSFLNHRKRGLSSKAKDNLQQAEHRRLKIAVPEPVGANEQGS